MACSLQLRLKSQEVHYILQYASENQLSTLAVRYTQSEIILPRDHLPSISWLERKETSRSTQQSGLTTRLPDGRYLKGQCDQMRSCHPLLLAHHLNPSSPSIKSTAFLISLPLLLFYSLFPHPKLLLCSFSYYHSHFCIL